MDSKGQIITLWQDTDSRFFSHRKIHINTDIIGHGQVRKSEVKVEGGKLSVWK